MSAAEAEAFVIVRLKTIAFIKIEQASCPFSPSPNPPILFGDSIKILSYNYNAGLIQ